MFLNRLRNGNPNNAYNYKIGEGDKMATAQVNLDASGGGCATGGLVRSMDWRYAGHGTTTIVEHLQLVRAAVRELHMNCGARKKENTKIGEEHITTDEEMDNERLRKRRRRGDRMERMNHHAKSRTSSPMTLNRAPLKTPRQVTIGPHHKHHHFATIGRSSVMTSSTRTPIDAESCNDGFNRERASVSRWHPAKRM
ncbi:hypothetical protein KIN20_005233 [Parelaphostrongylus tenuis]|uniref:Uncharacterized protein n=1 Tax=Parelaphostrongylus tenuis TaxID=148309 RepID=A0AAD5LZT0_PARTN|nr:hypothetical protein KIN20_005233 [Parelaphostrongylus tenuis]